MSKLIPPQTEIVHTPLTKKQRILRNIYRLATILSATCYFLFGSGFNNIPIVHGDTRVIDAVTLIGVFVFLNLWLSISEFKVRGKSTLGIPISWIDKK